MFFICRQPSIKAQFDFCVSLRSLSKESVSFTMRHSTLEKSSRTTISNLDPIIFIHSSIWDVRGQVHRRVRSYRISLKSIYKSPLQWPRVTTHSPPFPLFSACERIISGSIAEMSNSSTSVDRQCAQFNCEALCVPNPRNHRRAVHSIAMNFYLNSPF